MTRVLIVDDNVEFTRMLGRLFARSGFDVEDFSTPLGVNARLLNRAPPIDAVVLDCVMPALPGTNLLSLLAHNERTASIPVLLISGLPDASYAEAAQRHPRARWLLKQDPMAIVQGVRDLLTAVPGTA